MSSLLARLAPLESTLALRVTSRSRERTSRNTYLCPNCQLQLQLRPFFRYAYPIARQRRQTRLASQAVSVASAPTQDVKSDVVEFEIDSVLAKVAQFHRGRRKSLGEWAKRPGQDAFLAALKTLHSRGAVVAFLKASNDPEFVAGLSKETWMEFFELLSYKRWLSTVIHDTNRALDRRRLQKLGISFEKSVPAYFDLLRSVVIVRQQHGPPLDLSEYKILLEYAAALGNAQIGAELWMEMKSQGIQPDVDCYNYYARSQVYAAEAHTIRNLHKAVDAGPSEPTLKSSVTFRYDPKLTKTISKLFTEMSSTGQTPNTETLSLIIAAMGRDHNLGGVAEVLQQSWAIDVASVIDNQFEAPPMIIHPRDSPLYPSNELLAVLATAYGLNGKLFTAFALIDYISQQCSLPIREDVWYLMLQWAYLDARHGSDRALPRTEQSRLPLTSVSKIFDIMVAPPYNIQPSMGMYLLLIKSLIRRRSAAVAAAYLRKARALHRTHYRAIPALKHPQMPREILRKRDEYFLYQCVRGIIACEQRPLWVRRRLPRFLLDFENYVPAVVQYRISTGTVVLNFKDIGAPAEK